MADPISTLAIIGGVATAGRAAASAFGALGQEEAIELAAKQQHLAYQQKTLQEMDVMQKVLQRQVAQATTRGVDLSSPSLQAIQFETLREGAKSLKNLEIEEALSERNARLEKLGVRRSLYASLFGDVAGAGFHLAELERLRPKGK